MQCPSARPCRTTTWLRGSYRSASLAGDQTAQTRRDHRIRVASVHARCIAPAAWDLRNKRTHKTTKYCSLFGRIATTGSLPLIDGLTEFCEYQCADEDASPVAANAVADRCELATSARQDHTSRRAVFISGYPQKHCTRVHLYPNIELNNDDRKRGRSKKGHTMRYGKLRQAILERMKAGQAYSATTLSIILDAPLHDVVWEALALQRAGLLACVDNCAWVKLSSLRAPAEKHDG